jgi:hypothetical protein
VKIESIIQGHEDKLDKKPEAKTVTTPEGSHASVTGPDTAEKSEQIDLTETITFDSMDQILYNAISSMANADSIKNLTTRQGETSTLFQVKEKKYEQVHKIMTEIVKNPFSSAGSITENKMNLSTLFLVLSNALPGLLHPDFLSQLTPANQKNFLGQHGYGYFSKLESEKARWQTQIRTLLIMSQVLKRQQKSRSQKT